MRDHGPWLGDGHWLFERAAVLAADDVILDSVEKRIKLEEIQKHSGRTLCRPSQPARCFADPLCNELRNAVSSVISIQMKDLVAHPCRRSISAARRPCPDCIAAS